MGEKDQIEQLNDETSGPQSQLPEEHHESIESPMTLFELVIRKIAELPQPSGADQPGNLERAIENTSVPADGQHD